MSTAAKLSDLVKTFAEDDEKFDKGNHSAGIRARKTLQEIKRVCQDRREEMIAQVNSKKDA